jgi:fucose 4-O-acetylase-like acetyltransferase
MPISTKLSELLEPIAAWFRTLGMPESIVHWGHPAMMAIVIFVMGSAVGWAGWRIRLATDAEVVTKNRSNHRKIAPFMFMFLAMGYTGGVLSLVMQEKAILESPHFWTGSVVIALLAMNGALSLFGFKQAEDKAATFRKVHAYLGSTALIVMFIHAALGLKLGLSI